MIVLCEGHDGTGRSELASRLAADLGLVVVHPDLRAGSALAALTELEQSVVAQPTRAVIVDRMHLTAHAHGLITAEAWSVVDDYLARRFSYLLLLVESPFKIEQRLSRAGDATREQIGTTCGRFNAAFSASNVPHKRSLRLPDFLDPTTGEPTEIYRRFVELIRSRLNRASTGGASVPI